jgi:RNA polymerase sigma-70 factor (ECF subfamily)
VTRVATQVDTLALLRRVRSGEPDARGKLLARLRPRLVLWAATRLSSELRAKLEPEDVAQEVILAVHKDLDRFDGEPSRAFFAWVFTIAENRVRDLADHFGAAKRRQAQVETVAEPSPEVAAMRNEQVARVRDALTKLAPDHRRVIQHVRLEEREVAEVAKILGRSENAVRVLYCRALKELRTGLSRDGD